MTQSHYDESANPADTSDDHVAERDEATVRHLAAEPVETHDAAEPVESGEATDADDAAAEPDAADEPDPADEPDEAALAADPRVRDAVHRLDDLSELPPAEHVEVYEAVHSSLQESLAEASRQADESPDGGSAS